MEQGSPHQDKVGWGGSNSRTWTWTWTQETHVNSLNFCLEVKLWNICAWNNKLCQTVSHDEDLTFFLHGWRKWCMIFSNIHIYLVRTMRWMLVRSWPWCVSPALSHLPTLTLLWWTGNDWFRKQDVLSPVQVTWQWAGSWCDDWLRRWNSETKMMKI